jgi:hypothetical protein
MKMGIEDDNMGMKDENEEVSSGRGAWSEERDDG